MEKIISITENTTNGDIIELIFPNAKISIINNKVETDIDKHTDFRLDWWNTSYKG